MTAGYLTDRIQKNGLLWKVCNPIAKLFKMSLNNYKETIQQLECKRDIYKQIKYSLSKHGDSINEKMFYAAEMNT